MITGGTPMTQEPPMSHISHNHIHIRQHVENFAWDQCPWIRCPNSLEVHSGCRSRFTSPSLTSWTASAIATSRLCRDGYRQRIWHVGRWDLAIATKITGEVVAWTCMLLEFVILHIARIDWRISWYVFSAGLGLSRRGQVCSEDASNNDVVNRIRSLQLWRVYIYQPFLVKRMVRQLWV